jgi:hypothetical protein
VLRGHDLGDLERLLGVVEPCQGVRGRMAAPVRPAWSWATPKKLAGLRPSESYGVALELVDDRRPFAPQPANVRRGDLCDSGVVPRPAKHVVAELLELGPPLWVVCRHASRANDEKVDVARGVAVASSSGAENRHMCRRRVPPGDLCSQAALQLAAEIGKERNGGRGEVSAVEGVQVGIPRLLSKNEALFRQPPKRRVDGWLRRRADQPGDIPSSQGTGCPPQDAKDLEVGRRANRSERAGKIHMSNIPLI